MDVHLDTNWCPGCDKQLIPKRSLVVVPTVANQPSSSSKPPSAASKHQLKRLGLVHGTGRVKPGGGIRKDEPSDPSAQRAPPHSTTFPVPAVPPPSPTSPPTPTIVHKVRTVISQEQTPLYCSEECRLADMKKRDLARQKRPQFTLGAAATTPPSPGLVGGSSSSLDKLGTAFPVRRHSNSSTNTDSDVSSIFELPHPPLPDVEEDEEGYKPTIHDLQSGIMVAAEKIKEALCPERSLKDKDQSRLSLQQSKEHVPPGWRHYETAWRKIVYGSFGPPPPRPAFTPRPPQQASPPVAWRNTSDPDSLSPFERLAPSSSTVPPERVNQLELLSKMKFVRTPGSTSVPSPKYSSSSSSSSSVSPTFSSVRQPSSLSSPPKSDSSKLDRPRLPRRHASESVSLAGLASSSKEVRTDPLARAMAAKAKVERKAERHARREFRLELESQDDRDFRSRELETRSDSLSVSEVESVRDNVRLYGPIMGRRAAGLSSAPDGHSWSYEALPPHIPLYPLPGVQTPKKIKRVERVRDETTGDWCEVEVEVPEPRKRLFLFGSGTRRQSSSLSVSSAFS